MQSIVALAFVFGLGANAFADSNAKGKKKPLVDQVSGAGYGLAGCGAGSLLFGAKPGKIQILAGTTNNIYGNQTFGITSGTSNCDIPEMGQQAAAFIEVNKEVVRKEAARGTGETVTALSMMLNCDQGQLAEEVRQNYDYFFGQDVNSYETVRRMLSRESCQSEG